MFVLFATNVQVKAQVWINELYLVTNLVCSKSWGTTKLKVTMTNASSTNLKSNSCNKY